MPGHSGLEIVPEIRKAGVHIPLLMVTAESEKDRVMEAIRAGITDYLIKPFDSDTLMAKLERFVEGVRSRRRRTCRQPYLTNPRQRFTIHTVVGVPEPPAVADPERLLCVALFLSTRRKRREGHFMPQAIVDPEELRRFAQNLKKFSSDVQDRVSALGAQMAALERTWRDQEQKKFAEDSSNTSARSRASSKSSNTIFPICIARPTSSTSISSSVSQQSWARPDSRGSMPSEEMAAAVDAFRNEATAAFENSTWRSAAPWSGSTMIATTLGTPGPPRLGSHHRGTRQLQQAMTARRIGEHEPACIDERKALARAKQRLESAQEKVEAVRHCARIIDHAVDEYRGARTPLWIWLESEAPKALAALRRMMDHLEDYLALHAPGGGSAGVAPAESRARGSDVFVVPVTPTTTRLYVRSGATARATLPAPSVFRPLPPSSFVASTRSAPEDPPWNYGT